MNDCLFCKIAKKEIPAEIIYEDERCIAFLDITPINPGHVLLIPKEHFTNLYEMSDEVLSHMAPHLKKLAVAIKRATRADGINLGMNNEAPASQVIFHAHFHIMPRLINDGREMWHGNSCSLEKIKETAEQIKQELI